MSLISIFSCFFQICFDSDEIHIHSYTSKITKQPTAYKEGIRTYTCKCGHSYTKSIDRLAATAVTGVSLNYIEYELVSGGTLNLVATVSPNTATNKNVTWTSSNPQYVQVSNGKVTVAPLFTGEVTITVKTEDGGKTATCLLNIVKEGPGGQSEVLVESVSLDKNELYLKVNTSESLSATVKPANASNKKVNWESSDETVATVNSRGVVSAVGYGFATITATSDQGKSWGIDRCEVFVEDSEHKLIDYKFEDNKAEGRMLLAFDDACFSENSNVYNHSLAQLCSQFTVLGYTNEDDLEKALETIGMDKIDIDLNTERDEVNYFIASRKINVNAEEYTLIFMGLIGSHEGQWYTNFDPGTGDIHKGFNDAKEYAKTILEKYISFHKLNDIDKTKILITGHSRGAATSNLLAADLIKEKTYATPENIFTYAFATPNSNSLSENKNEEFKRIFNIVNPEDFVTKVMPSDWESSGCKYGKYGTTYILPSATNDANYSEYLINMKEQFSKSIIIGKVYEPYPDGEKSVFDFIKTLTKYVKTTENFYEDDFVLASKEGVISETMKAYEFFQELICPFVAEKDASKFAGPGLTLLTARLNKDISPLFKSIINFFVKNQLLNKRFEMSHCAETYCAYMLSLSEKQLTDESESRKNRSQYFINCPVDIEITDLNSKEIVGKITSNVIDEEISSKPNSIVMSVNGDSKSFWLPENGNYTVKITGNDLGVMNCTVSDIDQENGEISRINFSELHVSDGFEFTFEASSSNTDSDDFVISLETGEKIGYNELLTSEELNAIDINVDTEGVGYASGYTGITKGDYVLLTAETDVNNQFIGWFNKDGDLICEETSYGFVALQNESFTAKFTNNIVDVTSIEIVPSELTLSVGEAECLVATILPDNATIKNVLWSSSNEDIVTVNHFGIVTAKASGSATVTATSLDGDFISECNVVVENENEYVASWNYDGNIIYQSYRVGERITAPQAEPKPGFSFVGWTPAIPEMMPAYNLTFTAVFEEIPETPEIPEVVATIRTPSKIIINYGDSIWLHANIEGELLSGAKIIWTPSNNNFEIVEVSADGMSCKITPKSSGTTTFTFSVVDVDEKVLTTDTQDLTAKAGLWQKIVAFFKKLFGATKTYPELYKSLF